MYYSDYVCALMLLPIALPFVAVEILEQKISPKESSREKLKSGMIEEKVKESNAAILE